MILFCELKIVTATVHELCCYSKNIGVGVRQWAPLSMDTGMYIHVNMMSAVSI